jgi:putative redox protein
MKIILLSDDAIRLEPIPGPMTIEALSAEQSYSPFHMLASGLATCTFSVMHAWATHASLAIDDLAVEVRWTFAEDPHRVDTMHVAFEWPSLPAKRHAAARRVAEMCTIHATLLNPPTITVGLTEGPGATSDHSHADEVTGVPSEAIHSESTL